MAELPRTNNYILLEKVKERDKRFWYKEEYIKNSWSKVVLAHQIELKNETGKEILKGIYFKIK